MLTTRQLAARLGVHPETILRRVREGKLRPIAITPRLYVWDWDKMRRQLRRPRRQLPSPD